MRSRILALALLLAFVVSDADAVMRRRHRKLKTTTEAPEERRDHDEAVQQALMQLALDEKAAEERFQETQRARLREQALNEENEITDNEVLADNPCTKVHCSAGRVCEINNDGEAACNCIKECPYETEHRRKVCTNYNETWTSDCEVYQQRCLCLDGSELCKGERYLHVQIDYYGMCKEMPECAESEMLDFPRRMRDWLFNVMRDLAVRSELTPHYLKMEQEAEQNLTKRWSNAAIWKWCDLDAHDNDRFVSRHELFPIRAPLMSLEHCISPFLDACDEDDDHRITLLEWGKCLQLDEFELEDRCDELAEEALLLQ